MAQRRVCHSKADVWAAGSTKSRIDVRLRIDSITDDAQLRNGCTGRQGCARSWLRLDAACLPCPAGIDSCLRLPDADV